MTSALQIIIPLFSGIGVVGGAALLRALFRIFRVVHRVEAQMQNNGGSSLRDAIDRIEHRQLRVMKHQRKTDRRLRALETLAREESSG